MIKNAYEFWMTTDKWNELVWKTAKSADLVAPSAPQALHWSADWLKTNCARCSTATHFLVRWSRAVRLATDRKNVSISMVTNECSPKCLVMLQVTFQAWLQLLNHVSIFRTANVTWMICVLLCNHRDKQWSAISIHWASSVRLPPLFDLPDNHSESQYRYFTKFVVTSPSQLSKSGFHPTSQHRCFWIFVNLNTLANHLLSAITGTH